MSRRAWNMFCACAVTSPQFFITSRGLNTRFVTKPDKFAITHTSPLAEKCMQWHCPIFARNIWSKRTKVITYPPKLVKTNPLKRQNLYIHFSKSSTGIYAILILKLYYNILLLNFYLKNHFFLLFLLIFISISNNLSR